MAYYARVDENGIVTDVTTCADDESGVAWLQQHFPANWVQTSYNTRGGVHYGQDGLPDNGTPLRKNYAGIGYTYDGVGFSPPQPYPSWVKNIDTYLYGPPVPMPTEGGPYSWDEVSWNTDQVGWVTG